MKESVDSSKTRRRRLGGNNDTHNPLDLHDDNNTAIDDNEKKKINSYNLGRNSLKSLTYPWRVKSRDFHNENEMNLSTIILTFCFGIFIGVLIWTLESPFRTFGNRNDLLVKRNRKTKPQEYTKAEILLNQYEGIDDFFYTMPESLIDSPNVDFGGLNIVFMQEGRQRTIQADPLALHGHVWKEDEYDNDDRDEYYAFDDDRVRNLPFQDIKKQCRRVSWHKNYFPNCNIFHEIKLMKGRNRLLGHGAYREAYLQHEIFDPDLVVKLNRFKKNPFSYDRYEFIRMDALVMERLTASPRIVDIYGHCATSVYSEFLPDEAEELIIPGEGYGETLNDKDDVDPQNSFSISEKLDIAIEMAESIADLHGFKDGVLVHDDIQLCQWLFAPDGRLKLNDFNRAEAMLFDEEDGSYCRYQNGKGGGNYRAPEEYRDDRLNEKIDMFSFGNNIYGLITGLWVFYQHGDEETKDIINRIKKGETAYVDPRYRGKNHIQDKLIDLMYQCWKYEPDDRIDIFSTVAFLRELLVESKKLGIYDGKF